MSKKIHLSAKAIIIENDKILLIKKVDAEGEYYVLPGGGQKKRETIVETVARECLEEIGQSVTVHDLVFVRDYIAAHHEFANDASQKVHQVDMMFACTLNDEFMFLPPGQPDTGQIGVEWIALDKTYETGLYPRIICQYLTQLEQDHPIYLGDVN